MVLYGKQYCDIDPSDLCITQDKKTERKNLMMNREIEKRLQQIEKQNRQKEKPGFLQDNQTMMGSMTFGVNFWGVEFHIT